MPLIPWPYTREDARAFVSGELGLGPHGFAVDLAGEPRRAARHVPYSLLPADPA